MFDTLPKEDIYTLSDDTHLVKNYQIVSNNLIIDGADKLRNL